MIGSVSSNDDDMEGLLNTIPFSSGGGGGGGGTGSRANEVFADNSRTQSESRRRASSARLDSEPGHENEWDSTSSGKAKIWKHQLEGRSGSWQNSDEKVRSAEDVC